MSTETDKPADRLLEAIKRWEEHVTGKTPEPKELLKKATAVIKERLGIKR